MWLVMSVGCHSGNDDHNDWCVVLFKSDSLCFPDSVDIAAVINYASIVLYKVSVTVLSGGWRNTCVPRT